MSSVIQKHQDLLHEHVARGDMAWPRKRWRVVPTYLLLHNLRG